MAKSSAKKAIAGQSFTSGMPPLRIQFRNVPASPALGYVIRGKAEGLFSTVNPRPVTTTR